MTITTVGIGHAKNVFAVSALTKMVELLWLNPKYRVLRFLCSLQVYLLVLSGLWHAPVLITEQKCSGSITINPVWWLVII